MTIGSTILNLINAVPQEAWDAIIGGLFLSPFMLGIKTWYKVHHEIVMLILVISGAFLLGAIAFIQANPDFAPWLFIPVQAAGTFLVSQPAYYLIVKPLKKRWAGWVKEAEELNSAKRAAAVPAETTNF